MLEAFTGCEQENKYKISAADSVSERKASYPFLYAREKSECLNRLCLSGECRPFEIFIEDLNRRPFMRMIREC